MTFDQKKKKRPWRAKCSIAWSKERQWSPHFVSQVVATTQPPNVSRRFSIFHLFFLYTCFFVEVSVFFWQRVTTLSPFTASLASTCSRNNPPFHYIHGLLWQWACWLSKTLLRTISLLVSDWEKAIHGSLIRSKPNRLS